jgi:5-methylcytosine-specific restriction endonuclease McrA
MEMTLVLNATFEPLKIVDWQRAMVLWCQGKVEIVETHDREARSVSFTFKLPSVVRLLRFVKVRLRQDYVPFTRANIYMRDDYTCQFCSQEFTSEDLTFDHVVPVAQGGRKDWTNIVTACVPCNKRKGARTPQEAGMTLQRVPRKPASTPALRVTVGLRRMPASWRDYLYWNVELDQT